MKFYETTYIVHSALQEGRLNDIIESIDSFVKSGGGEILFFDNLGRKKLSYMIEKQKYGTYVFFQFKISDSSKIKNLSMEFEHNPNILRALTVKIEEEDILDKVQMKEDADESNKKEKPVSEKSEKPEAPSESKENTVTDKVEEVSVLEETEPEEALSNEVKVVQEEAAENDDEKNEDETKE